MITTHVLDTTRGFLHEQPEPQKVEAGGEVEVAPRSIVVLSRKPNDVGTTPTEPRAEST